MVDWKNSKYLTDVFGQDLIDTMPTVHVQNGATDYHDLVKAADFQGQLFVKGVDDFCRHAVSFCVEIEKEEKDGTWTRCSKSLKTLFQRYPQDSSFFVICNSHMYKHQDMYLFASLLDFSVAVDKKVTLHLKTLVRDFKLGQQSVLKYNNQDYRIRFCNPEK